MWKRLKREKWGRNGKMLHLNKYTKRNTHTQTYNDDNTGTKLRLGLSLRMRMIIRTIIDE